MSVEEDIAKIIRDFDWDNYSLDVVGAIEPENAEYATDLAKFIVQYVRQNSYLPSSYVVDDRGI